MQIPKMIWPIKDLGEDEINGKNSPAFALAHWRSSFLGAPLDLQRVQSICKKHRSVRGGCNGRPIMLTDAFHAFREEGLLPFGTTLRRVDDLSVLVYGPLLVSYRICSDFRSSEKSRVVKNTGHAIGSHTMLLFGWDGKHIHLANSWGMLWGSNGVCRMQIDDHHKALIDMHQVVLPGQPSTQQEAATAASDPLPRALADRVAALHRNLIVLGSGLPTPGTAIMSDLVRRSMDGELAPEQIIAKCNFAYIYTTLLSEGVPDSQIKAVHARQQQTTEEISE